jgi:UDP-N-acetyl-D-galactosamine dehydrogenase
MSLYEQIVKSEERIAVVGMGYVGMPLAVAFAEKGLKVIGFDINSQKINEYIAGRDATEEVGDERLQQVTNIEFSSNPEDLKRAKFIIVAVPTPVLPNKMPDLRPIEGASSLIGQNISRGSIVVYESTVYPGATEETCIPILEKESGLACGKDFKIGYSPERINPGDKVHRVENIVKVTSGMDEESAETVAKVYELIIKAGVHRATSIKVAEAAKVIENSQRDINIAFVNELSLIFDKMGIDTLEVLEAAGTKWNFLPFRPGLVGGHCIGVDPYYLAYKAEELGYKSKVILAGRMTNDGMGKFVAEKTVKKMIAAGHCIKGAKVAILGLTFKENCPDLRNSKVEDIILELKEYGIEVIVSDPIADAEEAKHEYGVELVSLDAVTGVDAVILAVNHNAYLELDMAVLKSLYDTRHGEPILIDVKGALDKSSALKAGFEFWRM